MMKHLSLLLTTTALFLLPNIAKAQTYTPSNRNPVADNSIGSVVNPTGANNFNIDGGLQRGQNLFHSFTDFSIPTGGAANFTNPAGNQSIITRVTGNFISDLNGTLNTNGANFLLINPNGVAFGTDARLNVGKAFVTSTANGIDFVDAAGRNYNFGVNRAGDAPLISIDPNVAFSPARLVMGETIPGSKGIENYGTLQTNNPGQYIGLIGGDVTFSGGQLIAPGAKVELGGLVQSGTIGFSLDNGVQFPANVDRGNVSLVSSGTSPSIINVLSSGSGSVKITAKNIYIQGKDTIVKAGIADRLGSSTTKAGDIKLNATGTIELSEASIANIVNTGAIGNGGNIEIVSNNLLLTKGAQLNSLLQGEGSAGNIRISSDNVLFDSGGNDRGSLATSIVAKNGVGRGGNVEIESQNLSLANLSGLIAGTQGKGNAGNVVITTLGNLFLTKGSQIQAGTYGEGNAGNIIITAGNIALDGKSKDDRNGFSSAIISSVEQDATGKGGNLDINAQNLAVTNGAILSVSTRGRGEAGNIKIFVRGDVSFDSGKQEGFISGARSRVQEGAVGKGGNIEINARNLTVTNGAQLTSSSYGTGDAGNVIITTTQNVSFDGIKNGFNSAVFSTSEEGAVGKGGNIEINTQNLEIVNGAGLIASTRGQQEQGSGGNILLKSNIINISRGGIVSQSTSSNGGNIQLLSADYLLLRNDSLITTDSTSTDKNGNGGNITISSPLIIALPGNNDITANANQGNGGKVNITSQGLFGIQYRPIGTDFTNDITASSTFGQSGNVQINTPGIDPGKDTGELPAAPNDASNQISQACGASQRDNKFYITGRGGLPPNASEPQESEALWQDARATKTKPATTATQPAQLAPPAIGWVFEKDGRVRLIAAQTAGGATKTRVVCPNQN